jgi:hypothetical protein
MDYAKKDHIVMFCDGNGHILKNPFPSETTLRGYTSWKTGSVLTRSAGENSLN